MKFYRVLENWELMLQGLFLTVQLTVISLVIGLFIAVTCALLITARVPVAAQIASAYSYVFRGTPLLIQAYLFYYGLGSALKEVEWLPDHPILGPIYKDAYWYAILVFSLNTGAYTCEILRNAISATPHGEIEAAKAAGMSWWKQTKRIVLPSAFRRALPAYSNEVIFMMHSSSVAAWISLVDLLGAAKTVKDKYYLNFEPYVVVALMYLVLTFVLVILFKVLEHYLLAHLRTESSQKKPFFANIFGAARI